LSPDPLTPDEHERFEALAPYADTDSLSAADAQWLADRLQRHPALANVLAQHRALRRALHEQHAALPEDIGLARAKARIATLPRRTGAAPAAAPGLMDRLRAWLQPQPAWAVAFSVLLLPVAFLAGRETVEPPYATVRSTAAPGLFDGPLLRVNFQPQTPEHVMRESLLEQGALIVGPTRLGDWFVKVAPARIETVRAALAKLPAVATAELVPALPSELVDPP
jgi:anti-sigma factor RsiW